MLDELRQHENRVMIAGLRVARRAIAEKGWTQEADARDIAGDSIDPTQPEAVCFCILGAVQLGLHETCYEVESDRYHSVLRRAACTSSLMHFNDEPGRTREEVLEVFDKAIEIVSWDML